MKMTGSEWDSGCSLSPPMTEHRKVAVALRNRAIARLSLKRPSKIDEGDAALDYGAADLIDALASERDGLREALGAVSVEISSAESYNAKIESIVRAVLEEGGGDD